MHGLSHIATTAACNNNTSSPCYCSCPLPSSLPLLFHCFLLFLFFSLLLLYSIMFLLGFFLIYSSLKVANKSEEDNTRSPSLDSGKDKLSCNLIYFSSNLYPLHSKKGWKNENYTHALCSNQETRYFPLNQTYLCYNNYLLYF